MDCADKLASQMAARIREAIHPDRIMLFGSRARGDADPESDFDLLIVAPSSLPRWKRTVPIYRLLAGMGVGKDVIWWTPQEVREWSGVLSHFINTILREGRILYERPA